jgi:hypothetical protein
MPCRGTGKVISNLGGKAAKITCPWCEGEGTRRPGIDAQARWLGGGERGSEGEGTAESEDAGAEEEEGAAAESAVGAEAAT